MALGVACLVAGLAGATARAADPPREVHGSADALALPEIAIAWGVLRAPKEDETTVVIRIEPDPQAYAWIDVVGRDPFTRRETPLLPISDLGGAFDLKVPRTRFADYPRTEIRLWARATAPGSSPPALVIYYLGIPDTTPESRRGDELERSLSERIERARADLRKRTS